MLRPIIAAVILAASMPVGAQVYKCQEGGKTVYSQQPCGASSVAIDATPAAGSGDPAAAARANERLQAQQRERQQREHDARQAETRELRNREQDARDNVRRIQSENYNPQKCAEIRGWLERRKARGSVSHLYDPDVMEFKQMESLYCGGR